MKTLHLIIILLFLFHSVKSQVIVTSPVVEGGKALVELIRIFKTPKKNMGTHSDKNFEKFELSDDNCMVKQQSDLCFKNNTSQSIMISIYRRNGTSYEEQPFTMKVLSQKEECWFELKAGIYKYKIEIDSGIYNSTLREGEFKLEACDNMEREIKD
ncbi:MAG: hypothetical protein ABIP69_02310 [Ferruginibacter sp.]